MRLERLELPHDESSPPHSPRDAQEHVPLVAAPWDAIPISSPPIPAGRPNTVIDGLSREHRHSNSAGGRVHHFRSLTDSLTDHVEPVVRRRCKLNATA